MSFECVSSVPTPVEPCTAFNTTPSHTIHKYNLVSLSLKNCSCNLQGDPLQISVWQQMEDPDTLSFEQLLWITKVTPLAPQVRLIPYL